VEKSPSWEVENRLVSQEISYLLWGPPLDCILGQVNVVHTLSTFKTASEIMFLCNHLNVIRNLPNWKLIKIRPFLPIYKY
jgi:hypothetical protein